MFLAEQQEPIKRRVALKIIKLGMDTKELVARFEAERQALAMMDHPNIAKVLDAGATATGRPFFVMELVQGAKITDYCDQNHLSTRERLELFVQVSQAVQHAHQKGIIHRDLKPSNILVTQQDGVPVPKVIDFGIAKATSGQLLADRTIFTAFEQFMGTPAYMSPEQAGMSGLDIDTRSDIYSLGVLLYELLTGTTPFETQELAALGIEAIRRIIREQDPPKPSARLITMVNSELTTTANRRQTEPPRLIRQVRGDLDWIVIKCLEKDRSRRYETANDLGADILRHLNHDPVIAGPPSSFYRLKKFVRRNQLAFGAGLVVAATLVIGLGVSTWLFLKEKTVRERAETAEKVQNLLRRKAESARTNETIARQRAETNEKQTRAEAIKRRQVAQFLKEMLQGVRPAISLGRDTSIQREILDHTVERIGRDLQANPEVEAELRNTIGDVYFALGEYELAETMIRDALALRRRDLGDDNLEVAESLNSLARVLCRRSRLLEAEAVQRQALALRKKLLPQTHPQVADSLGDLALILDDKGNYQEAETLNREALALRKQSMGNVHPMTATSLNNLAVVLYKQAKLPEAEDFYRQALNTWTRVYTNEHLDMAPTLSGLGEVLADRGELDEAEDLLHKSLDIRRKYLGEAHPETADALGDLASGTDSARQIGGGRKREPRGAGEEATSPGPRPPFRGRVVTQSGHCIIQAGQTG